MNSEITAAKTVTARRAGEWRARRSISSRPAKKRPETPWAIGPPSPCPCVLVRVDGWRRGPCGTEPVAVRADVSPNSATGRPLLTG
ncbi:hypothetical protein GCM10010488_32120 [Oerskovia jenensis]